jgi:hypothetical protein
VVEGFELADVGAFLLSGLMWRLKWVGAEVTDPCVRVL